MADKKLHCAGALLFRALGQQHVGALHRKVVAIGVCAYEFLGFAIDVVHIGAVVPARVSVCDHSDGQIKQDKKQCARRTDGHACNGNSKKQVVQKCITTKAMIEQSPVQMLIC